MRPSFVDFIMTCIEDDDDDNAAACQAGVIDGQHRIMKSKSGLQDITNTEPLDDEIAVERKTQLSDQRSRANNGQRGVTRSSTNDRSKTSSSPEDKQHSFGDGDTTSPERARSSVTSRLLDELEVDKDLITSHEKKATPSQGRKDALEDIRRRRQERQLHKRRSLEDRNRDEARKNYNQADENDSENDSDIVDKRRTSNDSRGERKRHAGNLDAGTRKSRRSGWAGSRNDDAEVNREMNNREHSDFSGHHSKLAQDTQTQSEDDAGEETENEDDLDVTATIPQLFSNRKSMSTKRGKNDADDDGVSEMEQEPRMMYGDTKLEFTQDSEDST